MKLASAAQRLMAMPYLAYMCLNFLTYGLRMFYGLLCDHGEVLDLVMVIALEVLKRLSKGEDNLRHGLCFARHGEGIDGSSGEET
jgi:hypothetical protein